MYLRQYPTHLFLALTTPRYYLGLLLSSFNRALLFLLISSLLLGAQAALRFNLREFPLLIDSMEKISAEAVATYPPNLEVKWDQTLTLSPAENLVIHYPSLINPELYDLPQALAIITPQNLLPADFGNLPSSSLVVVTPKTAFLMNTNQNWNDISLAEIPGFENPFTITSNNWPGIANQGMAELRTIADLSRVIATILFPAWFFITRLWMGLIDGLLLYFLFKLNNFKLSFKQVLIWSFHLVVIASLGEEVVKWLYPNLSLPMFTLVYWSYVVFLVLSFYRQLKSIIILKKSNSQTP